MDQRRARKDRFEANQSPTHLALSCALFTSTVPSNSNHLIRRGLSRGFVDFACCILFSLSLSLSLLWPVLFSCMRMF